MWRQRPEIFTFLHMCVEGEEGGNFQNRNTPFSFGENPPLSERWLEAGPRLHLQKPKEPDIPSLEVITIWPGLIQSEASTWREECKEAGSLRAYSWSRHWCRSPSRVCLHWVLTSKLPLIWALGCVLSILASLVPACCPSPVLQLPVNSEKWPVSFWHILFINEFS